MEKRKQIAKYYVATSTNIKHKEWCRILINGKKTRYYINRNGDILDKKRDRMLTPKRTYDGYIRPILYTENEGKITIGLHRLLACIFIPIPKDLRDAGYDQLSLMPNHIDGVRDNNDLSNLEWVTSSGNMQHALQAGLCDSYIGENSHMAKLTEPDVIRICELFESGKRPKEVAKIMGCSERIAYHIFSRESWKHVSKNYTFNLDTKSRLTSDEVHEICKKIQENEEIKRKVLSNQELANMFGVTHQYITSLKSGMIRRDIASQYNF